MNLQAIVRPALASLVYGLLGLGIFGVAFVLIAKSLPFSLRKEIEEDQNTSLAIVIASVIIGIAMILAAAVQG